MSAKSQRPPWLGEDKRGWDHIRLHIQLMRDDRITARDIAVYAGIAVHAELATGIAYPSETTLAEYAGLSERTVRRALRHLEDIGYIEVDARKGLASCYTLLPPPKLSTTPDTSSDVTHQTPDTMSGLVRTRGPETPDTSSDEQDLTRTNERVGVRAVARPHPLPSGWTPNPTHRLHANGRGWDLDHEAEKFRTHAKATGRKAEDWDAAFLLWLFNEIPNKPVSANGLSADERARRQREVADRIADAVLALEAGDVDCACGGALYCIDEELAEGRCRECGATAFCVSTVGAPS